MTSSYVLVVDDEKCVRRVLRRLLEAWGYSVTTAENAGEAMEMMLAMPASIAIIDIRMPGRDGLWLAEQLHRRWNQTAVIVATSADDIATIEKSRQFGVVDYLRKPFGDELLHQAIHRALKAIEQRR